MEPYSLISFLGGVLVGIFVGVFLVLWFLFKLMQRMARLGTDSNERDLKVREDELRRATGWAVRNPPGNPGHSD